MKLLKVLKELEDLYGEERVDRELERICLEKGVPHIEEWCRYCMINNNGWVYCPLSRCQGHSTLRSHVLDGVLCLAIPNCDFLVGCS